VITLAKSQRMVVISDLHLGNPFSSVRNKTVRFIRWAAAQGYDFCINGDGFEVAQVSVARMGRDVPDVLQALRDAVAKGVSVYYVVGNHDIVFEHFLADWGGFKLAPFLNVHCDSGRFRVEHGHLYDPFFVKSPRMYEFCTWLGGFALALHPSIYRLWIAFERAKSRLRVLRRGGIVGEPAAFFGAASELAARGFDGVIFGHTHHVGQARLPLEAVYLNPGSWMLGSTYVKIEKGRAELCQFSDPTASAGGERHVG
jgi:UDP-2,3-diacylglucosamine pyrophosphatase LpxH